MDTDACWSRVKEIETMPLGEDQLEIDSYMAPTDFQPLKRLICGDEGSVERGTVEETDGYDMFALFPNNGSKFVLEM